MISLQDRRRGSMFGALAGDAILAMYETPTYPEGRRAAIAKQLEKEGGIVLRDYIEPFKGKRTVTAGHPTDDSELAYALGVALVAMYKTDRPDDFHPDIGYLYLRDFIHGNNPEGKRRSYLTDGDAYGSGGTLRSALRAPTYVESFSAFREGRVSLIPSNGSLMRIASIPVRYLWDRPRMIEAAKAQSALTHIHPMAQVTCVAYSLMAAYLLRGFEPPNAWAQTRHILAELNQENRKTPDKVLSSSLVEVLQMPITAPEESEMTLVGSSILSLRIAIWATMEAKSFADGLEKVVRMGGDTDTYGAIAGGLMGAYYGIDGIPSEWREKLIGRDQMIALADELHRIADK